MSSREPPGPITRPRRRGFWPLVGAALLLVCVAFVASGHEVPPTTSGAVVRARQRLAAAEASHPGDFLEVAQAIDALATELSHQDRQALIEARALSERSLAIKERLFGPDHPEVARSLSAEAQILWGLEDYAAEWPLAERALAIRQRWLSEDNSEIGSSLYQIAELRRATGDYAGAIAYHQRALTIWEKTLGPESPHVASILHYLGVLRLVTGDPDRAKPLLERALAIRERTLGPMNDQVAATLNVLAGLAMRNGDRVGARQMLERTQAIWESIYGFESAFVARSLESRAKLMEAEGEMVPAGLLLDQVLQIRIKVFGPEHHLVGQTLADQAELLAESGRYDAAEALFIHALEIQRRELGANHPDVAAMLASLARLEWLAGKGGPAVDDALQAETIAREFFQRSVKGLTDSAALQYEATRTSGLDVALSALVGRASETGGIQPNAPLASQAAERIAEEIILSRALVLDWMASRHRVVDGSGAGSPVRRLVDPDIGRRAVLDALPEESALVAYVRYQRLGPTWADERTAYLGLVLRSGTGTPTAIPLGDAERIDALVRDWRREASADPRLSPPGTGEQRYRETGKRLREAIWDPLQSAIGAARQVFVVPDGSLNLVSLAALPVAEESYIVEAGPAIHYLSAERSLVMCRMPRASGKGVLVVGDPDFEAAATAVPEPAQIPPVGVITPAASAVCPGFGALTFQRLPGALAEAKEVASLWNGRSSVLRLVGGQAREGAVKRGAPGRRIVHLATHAYFLSERCGVAPGTANLLEGIADIGDQPLLRAGLALAGADHSGGADAASGEDGILTAEEIASLDLSGVEWAVLSGCDTGAGQVIGGEGVVGLRRAFEIAGARTLIMSLWAVDDGATRAWMRRLYEERLAGQSTIESVRRADLDLLAIQRARGRTTHPYFWGAFVAAGDWR